MNDKQMKEHLMSQHTGGIGYLGESPLTGEEIDINDCNDVKAAHEFDHNPKNWPGTGVANYIEPHIHEKEVTT